VRRDYDQAIPWLEASSAQGDPLAKMQLGVAYASGSGVEQSFEIAVRLLEEAAEAGVGEAIVYMSEAYAEGYGVDKDPVRAAMFMTVAKRAGFPEADERLRQLTRGFDAEKKKRVAKLASEYMRKLAQ
jgi:TPR repeat protein